MSDQFLQIALQAARAGGEVAARYFGGAVSVARKDPEAGYNLVTQADLEVERTTLEVIRSTFPEHGILAEETQQDDTDQEHLWIIDPIDGTNNFIHGLPHFAVSVAYYQAGAAHCGVVFNPATGDLYQAVRGAGAQGNGQPLCVAAHATLEETLVGVGFYYDRGAMMEATLAAVHDLFKRDIHGIRRFGTASLDLCLVAAGMLGAFFEYQLSPWDFAAGSLIVSEAGGRVTDCRGDPLPVAKSPLLATNRQLHDAMLQVTRAHHPTSGDAAGPVVTFR